MTITSLFYVYAAYYYKDFQNNFNLLFGNGFPHL